MTGADILIAKGHQDGRKEGIRTGRKEGLRTGRQEGLKAGRKQMQCETLIRLIQLRTGSELPKDVLARITKATPAALERWTERVIQYEALEDILS